MTRTSLYLAASVDRQTSFCYRSAVWSWEKAPSTTASPISKEPPLYSLWRCCSSACKNSQ